MKRMRWPAPRSQKSGGMRAAGALTKVIKAAEWSLPGRSRRVANFFCGRKNSMQMSRHCGRQSKDSWRILSPGGSCILTTAARTTPTATHMTPHAGCSSFRSHGDLNNVPGIQVNDGFTCQTITGQFDVRDIEYTNGVLTRLDVTF